MREGGRSDGRLTSVRPTVRITAGGMAAGELGVHPELHWIRHVGRKGERAFIDDIT